jgi:hypothetical protein
MLNVQECSYCSKENVVSDKILCLKMRKRKLIYVHHSSDSYQHQFLYKLPQNNRPCLSYFPSHFKFSVFISVLTSWAVYDVTSML